GFSAAAAAAAGLALSSPGAGVGSAAGLGFASLPLAASPSSPGLALASSNCNAGLQGRAAREKRPRWKYIQSEKVPGSLWPESSSVTPRVSRQRLPNSRYQPTSSSCNAVGGRFGASPFGVCDRLSAAPKVKTAAM